MSNLPTFSPEQESAKRVCARLDHACRDLRLYPHDHPSARHTMDTLIETLTSHLDTLGSLMLDVDENEFVCDDADVYGHAPGRDNIAFLMFRDGIRTLTFHLGVEDREVEALVDSLAHYDELADAEHDLTTVLWEHDLQHIEYDVVDPFLEGEGRHQDAFNDLRETVIRRLNELTSVSAPELAEPADESAERAPTLAGGGAAGSDEGGEESSGFEPETLDPESVALTDEEIEQGEWIVSNPSVALEDFVVVLLEIVGDPQIPATGEETLARSLGAVTGQYLDQGNLDGVDRVIGRLESLEAQGRRPAGYARGVFGRATTSQRLMRLMARTGPAGQDETARVEGLLGRMRDGIFPALLELLAESNDKAVRRTVLALLHLEGGVPARQLWPFMQDGRWYVVRNAVQLATGTGDPELVGYLERLLRHPDARVRREVMRSLDAVGGSRAAGLLARALQDVDSSVRTLAVRGLARHGGRSQYATVFVQVQARDFDTRPAEEVEALLLAFAGLGGDEAVETLNKLWKRRVFSTHPMPVRLAAIQALGVVGTPAAGEALAEAERSGDAQLQRAAARATSGAHSRMTGPGT